MRKISYHDFITYCPKDGTDGRYEYDGQETGLLEMIAEAIEESKRIRGEVFVHTLGLSQLSGLFINYLNKLGYEYTATERKNEMRKGSTRYSINDKYCFYMQIRTSGYKSFVTWQSAECVIGAQGLPETKAEALEMMELYHYTRQHFLAGIQKAETRVLYSSGTISRTMFNRKNKEFSIATQRMQGKEKIIYNGEATPKNVLCEDFSRPAVHGGFCDMSENSYHGPGIVLDKNSLYTWVATTAYLPKPALIKYGKGQPPRVFMRRKDLFYLIYRAKVSAEVKPDGIPCLDSGLISKPYLRRMHRRNITLTEADLQMLYNEYNVTEFTIISYLVFRADNTQFAGYLKPLYEQKRTAKDKIHRNWAKLMQNGLIGTFAKQVYTDETGFEMYEDGVIYKESSPISADEYDKRLHKTSGLCYINAAIVSEAKRRMIADIKKAGDRWLYTDTDSIHLKGQEIPEWADIGDGLGQYKVEHTFERCSYRGRKKYILLENHKPLLTVAGAPKDSLKKIQGKVPGIDYKYIRKAVQSGRIDRLWRKPIPVQKLETDLGSGTISYKNQKCNLDGRKKSGHKLSTYEHDYYKHKAAEEAEWQSSMEPYRDSALISKGVEGFNALPEDIRKELGFEGAAWFLHNYRRKRIYKRRGLYIVTPEAGVYNIINK